MTERAGRTGDVAAGRLGGRCKRLNSKLGGSDMDDGQSQLPVDCQKLERSLAHDYFCRFHMSVILAAVVSSGLLASKGLMEMGVSLAYRYPIAVAISYVVFLLLIRVWIWYVRVRSAPRFRSPDLGSFSFGSGGGGGSFDVGSIGGRTRSR